MSGVHIPASLRRRVRRRARRRCEYCHHPDIISSGPFHCDHFLPISGGGRTVPGNLVWACGFCNGSKGDRTAGIDPRTRLPVALFNPRTDSWDLHFAWSTNGRTLQGKTPTGRATIIVLGINRPSLRALRGFLLKMEIHPRQLD
jgi:5-methylcytosine-specific restriction endonuclease McrA